MAKANELNDSSIPESGQHTRLESLDDIKKAIASATRPVTVKEAGADEETRPFRSVFRPPMALLCILDDGSDDGEWVRIRSEKTVIGRTDGDVVIAHDTLMSGRHAEIIRQPRKGAYQWYLGDLGSSNGTFVRVADTPIKHGHELLLGSRRFRFNAAPQGADLLADDAQTENVPQKTRGWKAVSPETLLPSLIEITSEGEAKSFMFKSNDVWVGRDSRQCSVMIPDDLMISPRHCRFYRDSKNQWHLENAGSRNGTWVRISKVPLYTNGQFQLGEQRFFVRILS